MEYITLKHEIYFTKCALEKLINTAATNWKTKMFPFQCWNKQLIFAPKRIKSIKLKITVKKYQLKSKKTRLLLKKQQLNHLLLLCGLHASVVYFTLLKENKELVLQLKKELCTVTGFY